MLQKTSMRLTMRYYKYLGRFLHSPIAYFVLYRNSQLSLPYCYTFIDKKPFWSCKKTFLLDVILKHIGWSRSDISGGAFIQTFFVFAKVIIQNVEVQNPPFQTKTETSNANIIITLLKWFSLLTPFTVPDTSPLPQTLNEYCRHTRVCSALRHSTTLPLF